MEDLRETALTLPAIASAALSETVPFLWSSSETVYLEDGTAVPGATAAAAHVVSGSYFETMGTSILRGRSLADADDERAPRVAVVSASLAESLWPGADPLGRCLRLGSDTMPCNSVVGVAQDIRIGDLRNANGRQHYTTWPQRSGGRPPGMLLLRTSGPADEAVEQVRRALQAAAPRHYVQVGVLEDLLAAETRSWVMGARLFTVFGGLALLLGAFGLFTVMSHDIARRRRELGIRVALGARSIDLTTLVLRKGGFIAGLGILLGFAISWTVAPRFQGLLFDVEARDPVALGGTLLVLTVTAVIASLIPALRARGVEPDVVLRSD